MRRLLISLVMSAMLEIMLHMVPIWNDSFTVSFSQGQYHKIFHCGWPLQYAMPAEFESGMISLKVVWNVIAIGLVIFLLASALANWRARAKGRSSTTTAA
jgi:hypothetical protein